MIRDHELNLFQKIIMCSLAIMAVLFAVLTAIGRQQEFVRFEQMTMRISTDGDKTIYTGKKAGEKVTVVCFEEGGADVVDFTVGTRYHDLCRVEYPEGTITTEYGQKIPQMQVFRDEKLIFDGGYNPDVSIGPGRYYTKDGSITLLLSVRGYTSYDPWYDYKFSEGDILFFAHDPIPARRGNWGFYLATTALAIVIAVITALPNTLFHLNYRWYVRNPEPTDYYYASHTLSSIVLTGAILVMYIINLCIFE